MKIALEPYLFRTTPLLEQVATMYTAKLSTFGVDPACVGTAPDLHTPVVFCELNPPEEPPLLWVTGTGVSVEPARSTQLAMLTRRGQPAVGSRLPRKGPAR